MYSIEITNGMYKVVCLMALAICVTDITPPGIRHRIFHFYPFVTSIEYAGEVSCSMLSLIFSILSNVVFD